MSSFKPGQPIRIQRKKSLGGGETYYEGERVKVDSYNFLALQDGTVYRRLPSGELRRVKHVGTRNSVLRLAEQQSKSRSRER